MKKLFGILLAFVLAFTLVGPVFAGGEKVKKTGDKEVLEGGYEAIFQNYNAQGDEVWKVDLSVPKYLPDLVTPIDSSWGFDIIKAEWYSNPNLFSATVKGAKVTVTYDRKNLSWQPDVTIGTRKQDVSSSNLLIQDPINENYHGNTLQWAYGEITRSLRIIEGMLLEYYTISSIPTGDVLIAPHTTKDAGFVWTRPSVAWDANYNPVPLTVGGNGELTLALTDIQNATLPITIDPDTTFITSASDARMEKATATWSGSRTAATADYVSSVNTFLDIRTWNRYPGTALYNIQRSTVYFDTSALPEDATITNAVLSLYPYTITDGDNAGIYIVNGMPTYPHDPLVVADYNYTNYGSFATECGYNNDLTIGAYRIINSLNPDALKTIVDKTGYTKLLLIERNDFADETPANGEQNLFLVYSYEQGDGYRPKLDVTYTANPPAITADAASNIGTTTARLNATVTDDGGESCQVRWGYGTTTQTSGNFLNYDTVTSWSAAEWDTGEHPCEDVTNLAIATPYYYRVQIKNSGSTATSSEITFTTQTTLSPPTNFRAYPSDTSVALNWTKGAGAAQTLVSYSPVTYPSVPNDGETLRPSAVGDEENITASTSGAGLHWRDVSEAVADGDTTVVMAAAADPFVRDLYNVGDTTVSGAVSEITVTARARKYGGAPTASLRIAIKTGGTVYETTAFTITNTYANYTGTWTANPQTGAAWTTANLDALQVGCAIDGAGGAGTFVTQEYVTVTYVTGTQVYLGTSSSATHSSLTAGTTYYYSAWGVSGSAYSSTYATAVTTTIAYSEAVGAFDVPDSPPGWMQATDYTRMAGLEPIYTGVNNFIDATGMPRAQGWMSISLLLVAVLAIVIMMKVGFEAGFYTAAVAMIILGGMKLIPTYMIFLAIVAGIGIWSMSHGREGQ